MEKEAFYAECAAILNVDYAFITNLPYRRRWGSRQGGNGRFSDFGLIRYFGASCIHVSLSKPVSMTKTFKSTADVYEFLRSVV